MPWNERCVKCVSCEVIWNNYCRPRVLCEKVIVWTKLHLQCASHFICSGAWCEMSVSMRGLLLLFVSVCIGVILPIPITLQLRSGFGRTYISHLNNTELFRYHVFMFNSAFSRRALWLEWKKPSGRNCYRQWHALALIPHYKYRFAPLHSTIYI